MLHYFLFQQCRFSNYSHVGTTDESGALSEAMTKKYLGYALDGGLMGNWTAMIPGLIDVRDPYFFFITNQQMLMCIHG